MNFAWNSSLDLEGKEIAREIFVNIKSGDFHQREEWVYQINFGCYFLN